jgi:hypothetical protein
MRTELTTTTEGALLPVFDRDRDRAFRAENPNVLNPTFSGGVPPAAKCPGVRQAFDQEHDGESRFAGYVTRFKIVFINQANNIVHVLFFRGR